MQYLRRALGLGILALSSWWLVCAPQGTAHAQTPAPDPALTQRLEALCAKLDKKREEYHVPGMALAIVKDDKVVLARGFGVADVEKKTPADERTVFAIGSSSKAFTSALCAMMVDEGKIGWDDPVSRHFPSFTLSDPAAASATFRDVLSHRTGLGRTDMLWYAGTADIDQVYQALGRAKLKDEFRKAWNYNNNAYAAAGFAAARVAGTDWDALVRDRIFTPLGMTDSSTTIDKARSTGRLSGGYVWDEDAKAFKAKPMRDLRLAAPAGAINSTALDMARWVRLQLGRGEFEGKRLVSSAALETTWTKQIDMPGGGYAMGWMLHDSGGRRAVEHGGNIDGFAAEVGLLPDQSAGFVLLLNVSASALQGESQGMVWDALFPPAQAAEAGALPPEKLAELAGAYRFAHLGVDVTALVKDGKLHLDVPGQMVFELKWPDAQGKWFFAMTDQIAVSFVRDEKGQVVSMTMYQAGLEFDLPRKGAKVPPPPYSEGELAQFTGDYRFEALGRTEDWRVFVREGRLVCEVPKQFTFTMRWPDEKGTWTFQELKALTAEFERGPDGAVVAMNAHQGGMDFHMPRKGGARPGAALPTLASLMDKRRAFAEAYANAGIVRLRGTMEMPSQGVSGTVTTVMAGTDRFVNLIDFPPFGFIHAASDGAAAFSQMVGEPIEKVGDSKRDEMIRQSPGSFYADLRTLYDTAEVAGEETVDGVTAVIVKVSKKDGKVRARCLLNPENGLPLREETTTMVEGIGDLPVRFTYGDYREESGVLFPRRISIGNEMTGGLTFVYEAVETGVREEPGMFTLGPAR